MTIYSLLFLLLSNAVVLGRDKSILYARVSLLIFLLSFLITLTGLDMSFLGEGIGLYGGLFHATPITHTFHIFMFIISAIILQLNAFYPRKVGIKDYASFYDLFSKLTYDTNHINTNGAEQQQLRINEEPLKINKKSAMAAMGAEQQQFKIIEYPLIILFIIIGGTFLVSASDIVSIFLSIELQSYGLYLLCTLYRNSELSTSAGLTYFLLGGLSSCFILLGTSLLYANSGTTNLDSYYVITGISSLANEYTNNMLD
jgi:NADH-ubiquinone oxidoreductase chain 2